MPPETSPRTAILLVHDGELADVRALLVALALPFAERRNGLASGDLEQRWGLVLSTPRRLALLQFSGRAPACIAICDRDSRTLRQTLRRAGIELMLRRPFHPAALRGLVLHALYRGPERRRDARRVIGAPVAFRRGLRRHRAILADLSEGGCCLLAEHPVAEGRRITLRLPPELCGGRGFGLRARVLRAQRETGDHVLNASFEGLGERRRAQVRALLERFTEGPAVLAPEGADRAARPADASPGKPPAALAPAAPVPTRMGVALDEQAARVLLGRELSLGGMRVDRDALLRIGQDVRLALHVSSLEAPLVVTARVHRDEGARGMVLRFHALSRDDTRHLTALVDALPVVEPGAQEESGVVVSEILELATAIA
ncbi:MAG TPA: PilZ domain-containing protein [Myxococcota bacterium]|nr:PilZ domain-containing protein [Myxococcota bacterium]